MSLTDEMIRNQKEIERAYGATLTFSAASYACVRSTLRRGETLMVGEMQTDIELTLITRKALYSTRPVAGNLITFNSVVYRVLRVIETSGPTIEIDVGAKNR